MQTFRLESCQPKLNAEQNAIKCYFIQQMWHFELQNELKR